MSDKPFTIPPKPLGGGETHVQTVRVAATWQAPLPPPGVFEAYEKTLPGCASRLVRMVEREQEGRLKAFARGQLFAFILGMTGMLSGTWLIAAGKSAVALIPLVSALLPLVAGFLGKFFDAGKAEGTIPPTQSGPPSTKT